MPNFNQQENAGAINYLRLINTLEDTLSQMVYVNSVTTGDINEIDLNKRTIFPLVHIIINSVDMGGDSGVLNYNVTIMAMDIVNEFKKDVDDIKNPLLMGNDNEHFVFSPEPGDRIPDMRNTVLWMNQTILKSGSVREITFRAPSNPGPYVILVRGVAPNGDLLTATSLFEVE